jgi:hypothetical protein
MTCLSLQLKRTYQAIEAYRNISGAHWDGERGANIEGEVAAKVWNEYVVKRARYHCII